MFLKFILLFFSFTFFYLMRTFFFLFIILFSGAGLAQNNNISGVVINEFLADSENCCGGDIFDGNTEDFVELYNSGTEPINLYGWGFSDTDGLVTTVAPDTIIAPGAYIILWYTGDNNGFPEINEKLSSSGETIYIADSSGNQTISYNFSAQTEDVSYGRNPDGSDIWEFLSNPSPGNSNETQLSLKDFNVTPENFALYQNFPNPFNPNTSIRFDISKDALVNIVIHDMMGRLIKTLVNSPLTVGFKSVKWNGTNNKNEFVAGGVYIYTLQAGDFRTTKKMILLK